MSADVSAYPDTEPVPQKTVTFILVVDVSGDSGKIDRVNHLLEELLPILRLYHSGSHSLKEALLAFSDVCKWFPPLPASPDDFVLEPFQAGGTPPCLGMAYQELARRMSHDDLFQSPHSFGKLILMLISDGCSIDDHKAGMEVLSQNGWYQMAWRTALPLSPDANLDVLKGFIGDNGAVLKPYGSRPHLIEIIIETGGRFPIGEEQSPETEEDDPLTVDDSLWI